MKQHFATCPNRPKLDSIPKLASSLRTAKRRKPVEIDYDTEALDIIRHARARAENQS